MLSEEGLKQFRLFDLRLKNFHKSSELGTLICVSETQVFDVTVRKSLKANQINYYLDLGFQYCKLLADEKIKDAIFERGQVYKTHNKSDFILRELSNIPGNYYPRINRPFLIESSPSFVSDRKNMEELQEIVLNYTTNDPNGSQTYLASLNQLSTLSDLLSEILDNIYPSKENLGAYGHSIKNLLILSCIEVEGQLKGIYKSHELRSKANYSTKDYIKLKTLLQLSKYSVKLPLYPNLKPFTPFKGWSESSGPTKSLKWYDSYNAVKHNSETEFHKASLNSAINALCALVVLIRAQYGSNIPFWKEEIGNYFEIEDTIKWSIKDRILPPFSGDSWNSIKYNL